MSIPAICRVPESLDESVATRLNSETFLIGVVENEIGDADAYSRVLKNFHGPRDDISR